MVEWLAGNRVYGSNAERLASPFAPSGVGGWVELGRTTLGSAASSITVSNLANKRYYKVLTYITGESSNSDIGIQFNSDITANYSLRGAYDGTNFSVINNSESVWYSTDSGGTTPIFTTGYISNYATKEKLFINNGVRQMSVAPERSEVAGKWGDVLNPISSITMKTGGAPTFNSGSEVVVLGYDPSDTHTTNFWEELASVEWTSGGTIDSGTFTAKKYLWVQGWWKGNSGLDLQVNNDTGNNYANRSSNNGGGDGLSAPTNGFTTNHGFGLQPHFFNAFIVNNSANEKLMIYHDVYQNTATAGFAPMRGEKVGKWITTGTQITSIRMYGHGDNFTGGQIKVWGSN